MELENNEEGNGKGNKKRIAIIAVVVAAFLLLSPHEPEASSIKDAATTTQEHLQDDQCEQHVQPLLLPHHDRRPLRLGCLQPRQLTMDVLQLL